MLNILLVHYSLINQALKQSTDSVQTLFYPSIFKNPKKLQLHIEGAGSDSAFVHVMLLLMDLRRKQFGEICLEIKGKIIHK